MAEINSSDDDDLLRAAEALEKIVTHSDEELMEAAIALERIEIGGAEERTDKEEAFSIPPNLKLSPGMSSRHLGGIQGWKEGQDDRGGRVHGQGGAQVQGAAHQQGQGDGEQEED